MIGVARFIRRSLGVPLDAASSTGSANAKAAEHLARFGATQAGRIDVAVSSLLAGHRSIQSATIAMAAGADASKTATISSVTTSKSFMSFSYHPYAGADDRLAPRIELTNSTTITAYRGSTPSQGTDVRFTVYEVN